MLTGDEEFSAYKPSTGKESRTKKIKTIYSSDDKNDAIPFIAADMILT